MANELGVSESTISREISRNGGRKKYAPRIAQERADLKKERLKEVRKFTPEVEKIVRDKICNEQWSPKQIGGHYKNEKLKKKTGIEMVCAERIYQFVRKNKAAGGDIYEHMRHKLKKRARPVSGKYEVIKDKVSIDERPDVVNNPRLRSREKSIIFAAEIQLLSSRKKWH